MAVSQSPGGSHWPAREDVQRYAESHKLQQALAEAVQTAIKERAPNGPHRVAHLLLNAAYSPSSSSKGSLGDEQIEWRAKMVRDMAMGMELEIRAELAGSMLEAERCETFRALMAGNALSRGTSWFTSDDNFGSALRAALTLKQEIVRPETVLEMIGGLPLPTREKAVPFVVRFLDSPSAALRRAATELLGGNTHYGVAVKRGKQAMPSGVLAPHADAIVRRLDDPEAHIRHAAGEMLALLPPAMLSEHVALVVPHLEDVERDVREATLHALGLLPPAQKTPTRRGGCPCLSGALGSVSRASPTAPPPPHLPVAPPPPPPTPALPRAGKLPPGVIAPHTSAIVRRLEDDEWMVRKSALWVLRRLPQDALAQHADALRARLDSDKMYFRLAVHALLSKARPRRLEPQRMRAFRS